MTLPGWQKRVTRRVILDGDVSTGELSEMVAEVWRDGASEERLRWLRATIHDPACAGINGRQPRCSCGARDMLAELHRDAAAAIRARAT